MTDAEWQPVLAVTIPGEPAVQTLTLLGFPSAALARCLSPNGRSHWATRSRARNQVRLAVWAALHAQPVTPVPPPASLQFRYTFPTRRRRDMDNWTSGITKPIIDCLVDCCILVDDDARLLYLLPVELVVEPGVRRLDIQLRQSA